MLFENFIVRFIKLDAGAIFLSDMQENKLVFRYNSDAIRCLSDLKDLLNTIVDRNDGYYALNLNMPNKCVEFEFHEGDA